mmetsp:Transcript_45621/g.111101  ORF Transcript_45621/g.111101 Transcript_45621/m.111101 type:complete len:258 (+) Transcript_45621:1195-1968(+)
MLRHKLVEESIKTPLRIIRIIDSNVIELIITDVEFTPTKTKASHLVVRCSFQTPAHTAGEGSTGDSIVPEVRHLQFDNLLATTACEFPSNLPHENIKKISIVVEVERLGGLSHLSFVVMIDSSNLPATKLRTDGGDHGESNTEIIPVRSRLILERSMIVLTVVVMKDREDVSYELGCRGRLIVSFWIIWLVLISFHTKTMTEAQHSSVDGCVLVCILRSGDKMDESKHERLIVAADEMRLVVVEVTGPGGDVVCICN